jgi:hypothetical protein
MRTLDPQETYYIDADRKGLSWRGWTRQYRAGENYLRSSDAGEISAALLRVDGQPQFRQVVLDTANGIMLDAEMGRIKEHGYGKWTELAADIYDLLTLAGQLRDDLIVIVGFHVQVAADGEGVDHILTNGRKLEKVHLETKLPILLYARCLSTEAGNTYVFETQARGSTAKTPLDLFAAFQIPNDMQAVCDAVREYHAGDVPRQARTQPPRELPPPPVADPQERLVDLMASDGVAPVILSRWASNPKRGWLKANDLDMSHLAPDKVQGILDNWPKVRAACVAMRDAVEPFDAVIGIRRAAEVSGISDADLNAYAAAKDKLGFKVPWHETEPALLEKLGSPAVWEKASAWMKANREGK